MAKLTPKDPQFGIPVATRIRQELAFRFNKEAADSDKTLSRYVAEFIDKAATTEKRLKERELELVKEKEIALTREKRMKELETQITREKATAQKTASRFIVEISKGHKEKATQLIQTYNNILNDERRNNS
jgi:hypothetical protein